MKRFALLLLLSIMWMSSGRADVAPNPNDFKCDATIQVSKIITFEVTNTRVPDQIEFVVMQTGCDFVMSGKSYRSDSIEYTNAPPPIKPGEILNGRMTTNSAMGPNGLVTWAIFLSRDQSVQFGFSN
jgi:hypothetical protein